MGLGSLDYLAGFFDGEGCISSRCRVPGARRAHIQLGCSQTYDHRPLRELKRRFGGSYSVRSDGRGRWCCNGRKEVEVFLRTMLPLLVVKQPQAYVGIRFLETGDERYLTKMSRLKKVHHGSR